MNKKILFTILMMFCIYAGYVYSQINIDNNTTETSNATGSDGTLVSETVEKIKIECSEIANTTTKNIFRDFDPKQYNKNTEYKVNNAITRVWYNSFLTAFKKTWKKRLEIQFAKRQITLEQYAQIAFEVRHYARIFIRSHMSDVNGLETIKARDFEKYGSPDGPSFKVLLDRQLEKQKAEFEKANPEQTFEEKLDLDTAYVSIIDSSTRTNSAVNLFIKCYKFASESMCNYLGSYLASYMDAM